MYAQYTRPTLDLYLANKFWNNLTSGMSQEEIDDFKDSNQQLQ